MAKILVVEDDQEINNLLSGFLKENGYEVISLLNGLNACECIEKDHVDLVLLDLMLPFKNGDMILKQIREFSAVPVIILSAKETTQNKIDLLRLGADDYMTKPFDLEEALARIESNLRRSSGFSGAVKTISFNGLVMDPDGPSFTLEGKELTLTAKESAILELLLRHPDKIFSKANLFSSVWGEEYLTEDNALNVHISNLRNKLKAVCPDREFIDTVWGIGFRLHKD